MKKQEVSITTIPVTIRVVEVGGKKMTISVFRQIPKYDFMGLSDEDKAAAYVGHVAYDGKSVLLIINGILYKHPYEAYYSLTQLWHKKYTIDQWHFLWKQWTTAETQLYIAI